MLLEMITPVCICHLLLPLRQHGGGFSPVEATLSLKVFKAERACRVCIPLLLSANQMKGKRQRGSLKVVHEGRERGESSDGLRQE